MVRDYRMTISMDREIKDDLERLSRKMGISKADVIRMGIYKFIEEKRGTALGDQPGAYGRTTHVSSMDDSDVK